MSTKARLPVALTDEDQMLLEAIRTPGTPENQALGQLIGRPLGTGSSAASAVRALVEVARKAVEEEVMLTGYAALAAAQDDEDRAFRRAARRRSAEAVEQQ
ncbi:hypothetical protein [Actinomadura sp. 9N215]|uniref:hypothetical protein n=1 Tax=Actinomadura sp. 9N215 TaxID=3375150 RepID=UPI0037AF2AEE